MFPATPNPRFIILSPCLHPGPVGLLVPDLPLEETVDVRAACETAGIELVLLTTPTTPPSRMAAIAQASQGFVYLVSLTGVTGMKDAVEARVEGLVSSLKSVTDKAVRWKAEVGNIRNSRHVPKHERGVKVCR